MSAKYTKGPWRADRDNDVLAPDGTGIAAALAKALSPAEGGK